MFWNGAWNLGLWPIIPMLMCFGMMAMMMLMGMGHMGQHGGGHTGEEPTDPALDTLRDRFANGELTPQEYEEERNLLRKS